MTMKVFFECDAMDQLKELVSDEQEFIYISYVAEMERLLCITHQGLLMSMIFVHPTNLQPLIRRDRSNPLVISKEEFWLLAGATTRRCL